MPQEDGRPAVALVAHGRESLLGSGSWESWVEVLRSIEPGLALEGRAADLRQHGVRVSYLGGSERAALLLVPIPPRTAAEIRGVLARFELSSDVAADLGRLLSFSDVAPDYPPFAALRREGGHADLYVAQQLARSPRLRECLIFIVGLLDQAFADELRGILGGDRVLFHDLPRPVQSMVQRYADAPYSVRALLGLLIELVPARESTALSLVLDE